MELGVWGARASFLVLMQGKSGMRGGDGVVASWSMLHALLGISWLGFP